MEFDNTFTVTAPIDDVWGAVLDVERVAPCLPGASITGHDDDGTYHGEFQVKLGPTTTPEDALTLIERLCTEGFEVLIETGGFYSTEGVDPRAKIILDVKCPDSGEEGRNRWPNLDRVRAGVDEVKFVVASHKDWEYTKSVIDKYELANRVEILISPVWGEIDLKELAEWVSASCLPVRMQLQLHKYIWGAEARGV